MLTEEKIRNWIQEYFDGIQKGDFNDIEGIPDTYRFKHLMGLCLAYVSIPNGKELVKLFQQCADEVGKLHLRRKAALGEKIKIAFLAISAAEWPADEIYKALKSDERYEVYVVGTITTDRDIVSAEASYRLTEEFFLKEGYDYRAGYQNGKILGWDDLGGYPDICIHLTPWWTSMDDRINILEFPLSCINLYIPYGIYLADNPINDYAINCVYNMDFMSLMHCIYLDSRKNVEGFKKHQIIEGSNVVYSGYTKMDYFYKDHVVSEKRKEEIWKKPPGFEDFDSFKKVIIAPHHTMADSGAVLFSTFEKNYSFLYYLAKKYENISFIFKPHPNVRFRSIDQKLFRDMEEYEAYLKAWNDLPNARVVDEDFYLDIFETSDAMILDSVSFLAEYLYVNKPALLLTRREQAFNELGGEVYKCLYKVDGRDYIGIEGFIEEVVLGGKDENKALREQIFRENLDYVSSNGRLAYEYIVDSIRAIAN